MSPPPVGDMQVNGIYIDNHVNIKWKGQKKNYLKNIYIRLEHTLILADVPKQ